MSRDEPSQPSVNAADKRPLLDLAETVCAQCGRTPTTGHVIWSENHDRALHIAGITKVGPLQAVCGGVVVRKGGEWEGRLQPGEVVLAVPSKVRATMHYVRLGRATSFKTGSWRATPLCGTPPQPTNWLPLRDAAATGFRLCVICKDIYERHPT